MSDSNHAPSQLALAVATSLVFMTSPSLAQESQPRSLEEVIITATKRTESLQDVPISVGVVDGETLETFNITDLTDVQNYTPSLVVHSTFGNYAVRVRGLGSGVTNLAFDSSVTVYNDGVYCGRSKCMESAFYDVDRIEVARGPQGALFGKSTVAGAISIVSAKPTDEFEGWVKGGYEMEDGGYRSIGVLSGPLTDRVRGRIAVKYQEMDGWVDNPITNSDDFSTQNVFARASLAFNLNDSTEINLKMETGDFEQDGRSNQLVSRGLFGNVTSDPGVEVEPDDTRRVSTGVGVEDYVDGDNTMFTASLDTVLGGHSVNTIASFWKYDQDWLLDVDGVPEHILNTTLGDAYEQTSFETRILSPTGQSIEYIAGIWLQDTETTTRQYSSFAPLFFQSLGLPPFLVPPAPSGMDRNYERDTEAYSIYGQLTWNISERLRVIADLRYTDEEQEGRGFAFPVLFNDPVNPEYAPPPPFYAGYNSEYLFLQTREDDALDPSLRVQYYISDDIMTYVAYAEGSKAGGMKANDNTLGDIMLEQDSAFYQRFVGQPTVTPQDMIDGLTLEQGNGVFDFEDEQAQNIEVGAKVTLANGAATLNMALFTMQFDNLQTSSYDGNRFIIQNAASAKVEGFELEGSWLAGGGLRLGGALAYIDSTYDDFVGGQCIVGEGNIPVDPNCVDGEEDLSGERLERSPEWEVNLSANWETALTSTMKLMASATMYYSDEYFVRVDYAPNGTQDAFTKWDARLALAASDGQWEIGVVGRNLSDEQVIQHAYEIAGSEFQALSRGRTVWAEALYRF